MTSILHHKTIGVGPPVVVLHGLFGMLDNWSSFAKSMQEEYRFILVDQRNHGRSFHSEEMDYSVMAEDVLHLLDELDERKVMMMGHSMGGKTAMQFALNYPDRTAKLAVLDIAPKVYRGNHDEIFAAMMALDLLSHESRSSLQAELAERMNDPATAGMLLKNIARTSMGFSWRFGLHEIHDAYENLRATPTSNSTYLGSTLFVRGGKSPYIRDEDAAEVQRLFPNAEIESLPDAGHWVHIDAAEDLRTLLRSFFTG